MSPLKRERHGKECIVAPSRREVVAALGAGAALMPAGAIAQIASPPPPALDAAKAAATEAYLARFAEAWKPLDPQLRRVLGTIYGILEGAPPPQDFTPEQLRAGNAGFSFYFTAGAPPLPHVEERLIDVPSGKARVRLYNAGTPAPAPTIIYIHGGGWIYGSIDTYDGVARQLATRSGMRVLSIEYGLSPEHKFPEPLDDCLAAIRWALGPGGAALGIDPARIALCGDSAGGNLALAATLALRDAGNSPVRGAALVYGVYSTDTATASQKAYGGGPYFLGTAETAFYWDAYLTPEARANPLAVPILADLSGLPPLHIASCECDPLKDDSVALAARAEAAGAETELNVWPGMVHGSFSLMGWVDALGPEVDRLAAFLKRVTA